ncbi:584_t:CDS:2 [Funneliformis geosporum]|uniref:584_t:CDS:1 n=1 Tax=Funneliformis geosporum TaxID=1117311 RepID=A0A9W4SJ00_9GLOM|nr:584_t:CDS:2 [Funneliformis geosporum]
MEPVNYTDQTCIKKFGRGIVYVDVVNNFAIQPIEIGDFTKEESIEYLVNKLKIKEEAATILSITEKKLISARIFPKQKYHKEARQIINSLLTTKELEYIKYLQFFDNVKKADKVLEKNVFAYNPRKNIVKFQCKSVELYIKIEADNFGVKLIDLTPADEDDATSSYQMDTMNILLLLKSFHINIHLIYNLLEKIKERRIIFQSQAFPIVQIM